jgi:hypothetical protein
VSVKNALPIIPLAIAEDYAPDDFLTLITSDDLGRHSLPFSGPTDWLPRWIVERDPDNGVRAGRPALYRSL